MKNFFLAFIFLGSTTVFAENTRTVFHTASRSRCADATTVAANQCLRGDYWGAIRRGQIRLLTFEVASEKRTINNLCEVTVNCIFTFY